VPERNARALDEEHRRIAATAKRSPPSTNGETPRNATLMTTKFTPQRTTTSKASATSRGRTAPAL